MSLVAFDHCSKVFFCRKKSDPRPSNIPLDLAICCKAKSNLSHSADGWMKGFLQNTEGKLCGNFLGSQNTISSFSIYFCTPENERRTNSSFLKRDHFKRKGSSSNQHFSEDMLVFRKVCLNLKFFPIWICPEVHKTIHSLFRVEKTKHKFYRKKQKWLWSDHVHKKKSMTHWNLQWKLRWVIPGGSVDPSRFYTWWWVVKMVMNKMKNKAH